MFLSREQFVLFTDGGPWFSATGADVLSLLPLERDLRSDPGADRAVRFVTSVSYQRSEVCNRLVPVRKGLHGIG